MTRRAVAVALLLVLVGTGTSAAEDGIWLSREDAARTFGEAGKVPALTEQVKALETENAELRVGRDAALKLVEITEKILAAQERLTALAEQEAAAWKARAERVEKEAKQGRFWARVKKRAAEGGLLGAIGGSAVPGLGNALGAIGGAGVGAIVGVVEGLIEGL